MVRNWQGKIVVDIREFYVKDGKQMPGKKGSSSSLVATVIITLSLVELISCVWFLICGFSRVYVSLLVFYRTPFKLHLHLKLTVFSEGASLMMIEKIFWWSLYFGYEKWYFIGNEIVNLCPWFFQNIEVEIEVREMMFLKLHLWLCYGFFGSRRRGKLSMLVYILMKFGR